VAQEAVVVVVVHRVRMTAVTQWVGVVVSRLEMIRSSLELGGSREEVEGRNMKRGIFLMVSRVSLL
jgi:hypothetical protein